MNHRGHELTARRILERYGLTEHTKLLRDIVRALKRARGSRERQIEQQRRNNLAMRARRKAAGLCPRSASCRSPQPGYVYCDECRAMYARVNRESYQRRKGRRA